MNKQSDLTLLNLIACGNATAKSISAFSITSSGRRFVEINLVETTFGRIRPSPDRYGIRYSVEYEQNSNVHVQNCVGIVNN